jgi:hypothetical protein
MNSVATTYVGLRSKGDIFGVCLRVRGSKTDGTEVLAYQIVKQCDNTDVQFVPPGEKSAVRGYAP